MPFSSGAYALLALLSDGAAVLTLDLSRGLSRRLPTVAVVVLYCLGLVFLTLALGVEGVRDSFDLGVIYAAWSAVGVVGAAATERIGKRYETWAGKDVGPAGTMARVGLGLGFAGSVVQGQLATHVTLASWILGLLVFPALSLAIHGWRIERDPRPFHDTSAASFALSVVLPVALYLTPFYAPAFSAASDGTLVFLGLSMMLSALRGYAGCDLLAVSNWLLHRRDQIACAVFTPIDSLEWRSRRARAGRADRGVT